MQLRRVATLEKSNEYSIAFNHATVRYMREKGKGGGLSAQGKLQT